MAGMRPPTPEQTAIIDAFETGDDLVVEAGAGAGKTTTLRMVTAGTSRRGIYLAYNRITAQDARASFPANANCVTAHSLAYRSGGYVYKDRLNGPRVPGWQAAEILGIPMRNQIAPALFLTNVQMARVAIDTVARFCYSAEVEIGPEHVPWLPPLDLPSVRPAFVEAVLPYARKAWEHTINTAGRLKVTHDAYLKLYQLGGPRLDCDFILMDEAQDANPVVADIVAMQTHAQRVLVGDSCQAIYGWRGAVDAMKTFGGQRLYLSQSFRFGHAIAEEANKWLGLLDAPLVLRGYDRIDSRVGPVPHPDAILCRSNAGTMVQAIRALATGRRVALVGGGQEIRKLAEAAITLKAGTGTSHPELFMFQNWAELQDYVTHDNAGSDLKVFVDLVEEHGPEVLIAVVDRLVDEPAADLLLSTAHKAKGREWERVQIADDFFEPKNLDRGELMLAYVAVTRAQHVLDVGSLRWVDAWIATAAEQARARAVGAGASGRVW